jgi:chitin synthase
MLQQGWRIDYAASADAWTFAPETFKDFFVQRRRWAPSTLANIIDLLSSWRSTTKSNDNISTPFIFYQFILFASSLLGVGTICMMIAGSLNAVLKISMWYSFVIAVSPVVFFATVCFKCTNDRQIFAAGVMTCLFTIVMVFVTVGMCLNLASEPLYSPNVIFIFEILFVFITSGICHPKEIFCLVHGLLYYLTIPSTFIFLTVYYMCNIHVVTWGTREGPKKPENDDSEPQLQKVKDSAFVSCLRSIGITALLEETIQLVRQLVGRQLTADDNNEFIETNVPPMGIEPSPNKTSSCRDKNRSKTILQNSDHWKSLDLLGKNSAPKLVDSEKEFWDDILKKYLYPLVENKEKEKEIKDELISLRNNVALGFFLMNFLFALAIIQLQSNEDQLKSFYLLNEYEPLSVAFLFVFAVILAIQFCGMLSHRWGTFLHLISSVELIDRKGDQDINAAIKKAEKLQVAEVDLDDESLGIDMNTEDIIPDYPEEETTNIYRQTFRKNYETLTKNVRHNLLQNQHTRHHGSESQYMATDF